MKKTRAFKALWITLIVIASLLLAAVIVGALNATVGGGKWNIGWQTYRYDEVGFTVGSGTVYGKNVTAIDLDWISGDVRVVVSEDDLQVSLSEESEAELSQASKIRWKVDDHGKLIIKNRKSGTYFATAEREKDLVLRIPKVMAEALTEVDVNVVDGLLSIKGITANEMEIESVAADVMLEDCEIRDLEATTVSGRLLVTGEVTNALEVETVSGKLELSLKHCPNQTAIDTVSGDVVLALPSDASFRLKLEAVSGDFSSDFALVQNGEDRIHGTGSCSVQVESVSGDLMLNVVE